LAVNALAAISNASPSVSTLNKPGFLLPTVPPIIVYRFVSFLFLLIEAPFDQLGA